MVVGYQDAKHRHEMLPLSGNIANPRNTVLARRKTLREGRSAGRSSNASSELPVLVHGNRHPE
jgi:hypothetical protein